jgi:ethanolamine utilization microcompartment shell protein EutS
MDWANQGKGNRNPIAVINKNEGIEILKEKPRPGKTVTLDASKSNDPDGDKLTFKWWVQPEAGTYKNDITITNSDTGVITVDVPADSAGKTFHLICEITDNGVPKLTSYRRVVFEPK